MNSRTGPSGVLKGPWSLVCVCVALAYSPICLAHVDRAARGFSSGFLHPVFGLDHFLAMLSVGIVSAQLGGLRIWTIPATFVSAMIVGGVIGVYGHVWPLAESGIAVSVITLGASIVVASRRVRSLPIYAVTALFGVLHGHAHGLEMPHAADPVFYAAGFVAGTALIHLLGVGVGHGLMLRPRLEAFLRHLGSAMAGMGLILFIRPW